MCTRTLIVIALFATCAHPAFGQNLLTNPGFDRDLSGWTVSTHFSPSQEPGFAEASVGWAADDVKGSSASGSVSFHSLAYYMFTTEADVEQCVPLFEGGLVSFGAKVRTAREFMTAVEASVYFFPTSDCSGTSLGGARASSLPGTFRETNSGGLWLDAASQTLASGGSRSVLFRLTAGAYSTRMYGQAYVDALVDDAFLTATPVQTSTWILPTSAFMPGVGGSFWMTDVTLTNPGPTEAAVTLKFLGHDMDGRGGPEYAVVVKAGGLLTLPDILENYFFAGHTDFGAIRVMSSSPAIVVQSETWTGLLGTGCCVGESLPAASPSDLVGAVPRTLAPIRENAQFRTNLILANATEAPLVVTVKLYDTNGLLIGSREIPLQPLEMTQLNRVAQKLGLAELPSGWISVSTPTPGGLFAAYASVIDNGTNDPRALLPR
jgi:hypothetical protein